MSETRCFCGCGRSAAFGQARAVNELARELRAETDALLALALAVLHDDAEVPDALRVRLSAP